MSHLEPLVAVRDLSLWGLFMRLDLVERLKEIKRPTEEEAAALASEPDVKKAVGEHLQALASGGAGVTATEKRRAKEFLEAQLKTVSADLSAKGAEARAAKLKELLQAVESATAKDESAHVRKARQELAKAEKEFEEVQKNYERWEKGKKMLSVDELNALKRSHESLRQRVEAAKSYVALQQELRAEAAAAPPPALAPARGAVAAAVAATAGRGKAAAKGPSPSIRTAGGGGGYASAAAPSAAALRQAQLAAQVRAEAEAEAAAHAQAPAPAPRPRPSAPRPAAAEDRPVLSYSCTCAAVAEHLKISEAQAREMAGSSAEFAGQFDPKVWEAIEARSLAIEKAQREQQREAEKRKQAAALAKVAEKQYVNSQPPAVVAKAAGRPAATAGKAAAPLQAATKAKAKAKPQLAPKKFGSIDALANGNRFGGLDDDDDDDDGGGWTTVR